MGAFRREVNVSENLSNKQLAFVREYCVDYNATQAAIRAGYAESTAYSQGQRLLKNVEVKNAIADEQDVLLERTRISRERVLKELSRVAFTDMRSYVEWGPSGVRLKPSEDLTADDSAAVTEVSESYGENGKTLKFKLAHKDSALKMLAQHVGILDKDGGGVTVNVNNNPPPAKPLSDFTDEELDFYEKLLDADSADASSRRSP